ncbi:MAG: ATP-dependent endonuclease [Bacteroidia bacterium]|nr:ATP-dependent endonuclease [Bacteroidia bacterium]
MKISKIKIKNYRLLKDFTIDLEDDLSLIIGKNNCGKTSFLSLLERFLAAPEGGSTFAFDDFNIGYQEKIVETIQKIEVPTKEKEPIKTVLAITLDLHIEYDNEDDLTNISLLMLNLDPTNNKVILRFEYGITNKKLVELKKDIEGNKAEIKDFLRKHYTDYFQIYVKAIEPNNEENQINFEKSKVSNIINFQCIHAKRAVNNQPGSNRRNDKTLSNASSRYYDKVSNFKKEEIERDDEVKKIQEKIEGLNEQLKKADGELNSVYKALFETILGKVGTFGGVKTDDSTITIKSTLEGRNLLRENTSVVYNQDGNLLPEDYNGLGYMNLINMIFEIEMLFMGFKKAKPADINMIFIEEPEAHTHPQMQHIFIENIKKLLEENKKGLKNAQTIISTHSPHIVSKSDFEDIKYFRKEGKSIVSKNLKALKPKNENSKNETIKEQNFRFLKQYLTLNKAELFFADKAIFIEGDTERILLPAMMKKMDIEYKDENTIPLLSQHISIVEAGAYAHIFKEFIKFLGIKVLIITDLDSVKKVKTGKFNEDSSEKFAYLKRPVAEGELSSNSSIKRFLKTNDLDQLKKFSKEDRTIMENKVLVSYQLEEVIKDINYHPRSFEDAFIHVNYKFIEENKKKFKGLKNRKQFNPDKNPYELARDCISDDNKSAFALDILYFGGENFENWQIPFYIKQGLLWLRQ